MYRGHLPVHKVTSISVAIFYTLAFAAPSLFFSFPGRQTVEQYLVAPHTRLAALAVLRFIWGEHDVSYDEAKRKVKSRPQTPSTSFADAVTDTNTSTLTLAKVIETKDTRKLPN